MKLPLITLFFCLLFPHVSYTSEVGASANITLQGNGSVAVTEGVEQINVAGVAEGYITGTFVWEEQHDEAPEPDEAVEQSTITITDRDGDSVILSCFGRATMHEANGTILEGAKGSFTYVKGTGQWAEHPISGTYTKAGVFEGDSVKLSIILTVENE